MTHRAEKSTRHSIGYLRNIAVMVLNAFIEDETSFFHIGLFVRCNFVAYLRAELQSQLILWTT